MELNLQQFGGRGSSNPQGGGDGFDRKGVTKLQDGSETIDLSDSPLRYGKNDKALDGARRAAVELFEGRYVGAKVENGATFDANGMITEQRRGGKGSVKTSVSKYNAADTFSHNHPRAQGILGGTFSEADLSNFSVFDVTTARAAAKEGTYSISKHWGKFDSTGFQQYYKSEYARITKEYNSTFRSLNKRMTSNQMAYDAYSREFTKTINKQLVELHNVLISGQKKYGYSYTLERRK